VVSLTKNELVAIVDRVYASWNQTVSAANSRTIYESWWRVLADLTVVDVTKAVDLLVIRDKYMPRPGTVRRLVKFDSVEDLPPAPLEAWNTLRELAEASQNGIYGAIPATVHECVRKAISSVGGTAGFALHTNGDRDYFLDAYQRAVQEWEDARLALE
jgi:hypothetical protein